MKKNSDVIIIYQNFFHCYYDCSYCGKRVIRFDPYLDKTECMECIIKNRPKAGSLGGGGDVESKNF